MPVCILAKKKKKKKKINVRIKDNGQCTDKYYKKEFDLLIWLTCMFCGSHSLIDNFIGNPTG